MNYVTHKLRKFTDETNYLKRMQTDLPVLFHLINTPRGNYELVGISVRKPGIRLRTKALRVMRHCLWEGLNDITLMMVEKLNCSRGKQSIEANKKFRPRSRKIRLLVREAEGVFCFTKRASWIEILRPKTTIQTETAVLLRRNGS